MEKHYIDVWDERERSVFLCIVKLSSACRWCWITIEIERKDVRIHDGYWIWWIANNDTRNILSIPKLFWTVRGIIGICTRWCDVISCDVMCLVGWWVGGGEWDELSLIVMMKCSSLKCFVPFSTVYKTQREDEIIDLIARKHPESWILHFHSAPHTQNTSRHAWDELHLNSRCSVTQQFWQFSPKNTKLLFLHFD